MHLDYFRAAENDIRSLPMLKNSVEFLKKKQKRLIESGAPKEPGGMNFSKVYTDSHSVNDTLGEILELTEVIIEIQKTEAEILEIENALSMLPKEEREVLELFYIKGYSSERIAEKIFVSSEKTVYGIRNRGIYNYSVLIYGALARKASEK